ncbi:MAG: hypothetical protein AAGB12_04615 [Pseudomonadota bacterium]
MFSKWFKKDKETVRALDHPKDLNKGDMIQMIDSFSLPSHLKNQMLTVKSVNTYQFKHKNTFEFTLENSENSILFLTIEEEDGQEYARFSISIERDQVDVLFTLDQFAHIFDSEDWVSIEQKGELPESERWLAESYSQKNAPEKGFYYEGDYRNQVISKYVEDGGEPFEFIGLYSDDDKQGIEIEVWEDGETDVYLSIFRPLSDLSELYAKS